MSSTECPETLIEINQLFPFICSCNECKKSLTSVRDAQAKKEEEAALKSEAKPEGGKDEPKPDATATKQEIGREADVKGESSQVPAISDSGTEAKPDATSKPLSDLDVAMEAIFANTSESETTPGSEESLARTEPAQEESPSSVDAQDDKTAQVETKEKETVKSGEDNESKPENNEEENAISFETKSAAIFTPHGLDKCDECGHNSSVEYEQLVVSKDELSFLSSKTPTLKMMSLFYPKPNPSITWEHFTIGMAIDLKLTFSKWKRSMKFYEYWVTYRDLLSRKVLRCPSSGRFNVKVNGFEKILSLLMIRGKSYRNSDQIVQEKIKKILSSNFNLSEPHVRRSMKGLKSIVVDSNGVRRLEFLCCTCPFLDCDGKCEKRHRPAPLPAAADKEKQSNGGSPSKPAPVDNTHHTNSSGGNNGLVIQEIIGGSADDDIQDGASASVKNESSSHIGCDGDFDPYTGAAESYQADYHHHHHGGDNIGEDDDDISEMLSPAENGNSTPSLSYAEDSMSSMDAAFTPPEEGSFYFFSHNNDLVSFDFLFSDFVAAKQYLTSPQGQITWNVCEGTSETQIVLEKEEEVRIHMEVSFNEDQSRAMCKVTGTGIDLFQADLMPNIVKMTSSRFLDLGLEENGGSAGVEEDGLANIQLEVIENGCSNGGGVGTPSTNDGDDDDDTFLEPLAYVSSSLEAPKRTAKPNDCAGCKNSIKARNSNKFKHRKTCKLQGLPWDILAQERNADGKTECVGCGKAFRDLGLCYVKHMKSCKKVRFSGFPCKACKTRFSASKSCLNHFRYCPKNKKRKRERPQSEQQQLDGYVITPQITKRLKIGNVVSLTPLTPKTKMEYHKPICKKGDYPCPICYVKFQMNQPYGKHVKNQECLKKPLNKKTPTRKNFNMLYVTIHPGITGSDSTIAHNTVKKPEPAKSYASYITL